MRVEVAANRVAIAHRKIVRQIARSSKCDCDCDGDRDNNSSTPSSSSRRSLLLASTTSAVTAAAAAAGETTPAFVANAAPSPPPVAVSCKPAAASAAASAAERIATPTTPSPPPPFSSLPSLEIARARVAVLRAVSSASGDSPSTAPDESSACRNLAGYEAMAALHASNPRLFHALLASDRSTFLPLVYTPAVADACANWGTLLTRSRGLYLSADDAACAGGKGLRAAVDAWALDLDERNGTGAKSLPRLAVVSDGARILALGDLAAHGMGIPVGKCFLHSAGGGLDPSQCLPVLVDAGRRGRRERRERRQGRPFLSRPQGSQAAGTRVLCLVGRGPAGPEGKVRPQVHRPPRGLCGRGRRGAAREGGSGGAAVLRRRHPSHGRCIFFLLAFKFLQKKHRGEGRFQRRFGAHK